MTETDPVNDPAAVTEAPVTETVTASGYTEDEPYEAEHNGNKVWFADGKTYRVTPDGSQYVTDGDHTDTVIALSELYVF